jgi:16S rRNA (cytosine967-C5)-methyltransferase
VLFLTKFTKLDIQALIDALVAWERVKPGQVGKRIVFEKYGIKGSVKDYVFTAVIYKLERKRGLIDKIINASGLDVSRLDDYSKALLRLIVYEKFFGKKESRLYRSLIKHGPLAVERLSRGVVRINDVKAIIERIIKTTYTPSSLIEKLEFKYSAPYDFIKRIIDLIGQEEAEKFFESIEKLYYISFRVNTLKTNIEDV